MDNPITSAEIEAGVSVEHRHFFRVSSAPLPRSMLSIVEAFWTATSAIGSAMWFSHPAHIVLATAPFRLKLSQGELVYSPTNQQIINVHVEHWVFLDCNRMANLQQELKVACILEELVHSLMHITDESLVSQVVASLYPGVRLVDGRYTPVDSSPPSALLDDFRP